MIRGATLQELREDAEKNKMTYDDIEKDEKDKKKKIKLLTRPKLAEMMRVNNRTKLLIENEFNV